MAGSLVLGLTACGGSDSDSVKVGLITKTDSNPYFVKMREAAQAQADKDGAELIALAGAFDGDNEGQVAAIENMVGQGVKGILITPNSSTGVLDAIKKARDAGVIVIALDTATDPEDAVDATFATDNKAAGVSQGKWVKAALGNAAPQVVMLDGTPGGTVDTFRHDGFLEGFGITNDSPEIVGKENTNGDQTKAQTAMENMLQRAPGINALYTINEPAAAGAYQAIQSADRAAQITIGSIDGSCTGRRGREGRKDRRNGHAVPGEDGRAGRAGRGQVRQGRHQAQRIQRHRLAADHRQAGGRPRVEGHRLGRRELLGQSRFMTTGAPADGDADRYRADSTWRTCCVNRCSVRWWRSSSRSSSSARSRTRSSIRRTCR